MRALPQLHDLPDELLQRVLQFAAVDHALDHPLSPLRDTYLHLALVCRRWREALRGKGAVRGVRERLVVRGECSRVELFSYQSTMG